MPVAKDLIPVLPHLNFYPRTNRSLLRFSVMLLPAHLLPEHLICNNFSEDFPEKEDNCVCVLSLLIFVSLPIALQTLTLSSWEPTIQDDRCVLFIRKALWSSGANGQMDFIAFQPKSNKN